MFNVLSSGSARESKILGCYSCVHYTWGFILIPPFRASLCIEILVVFRNLDDRLCAGFLWTQLMPKDSTSGIGTRLVEIRKK